MFVNVFKSYESTLSIDEIERQRYQKLLHSIVKNGLTMKVFEKIKTANEAMIFLTQLKIFTPIEVKLMV